MFILVGSDILPGSGGQDCLAWDRKSVSIVSPVVREEEKWKRKRRKKSAIFRFMLKA